VPWRIEVTPSDRAARQYFLHVLEIAEEGTGRMSDVRLQHSADGAKVGVSIARPDGAMTLWFAPQGGPSIERTQ
jgi:hypothetical protein